MRIGVKGPLAYLQEAGIRKELGSYAAALGSHALVVASKRTIAEMGEEISGYLAAAGCECSFHVFAGDITYHRATKHCQKNKTKVFRNNLFFHFPLHIHNTFCPLGQY